MAGLGVGLPLSRVYARYFGGELNGEGDGAACWLQCVPSVTPPPSPLRGGAVISMEGYGTGACALADGWLAHARTITSPCIPPPLAPCARRRVRVSAEVGRRRGAAVGMRCVLAWVRGGGGGAWARWLTRDRSIVLSCAPCCHLLALTRGHSLCLPARVRNCSLAITRRCCPRQTTRPHALPTSLPATHSHRRCACPRQATRPHQVTSTRHTLPPLPPPPPTTTTSSSPPPSLPCPAVRSQPRAVEGLRPGADDRRRVAVHHGRRPTAAADRHGQRPAARVLPRVAQALPAGAATPHQRRQRRWPTIPRRCHARRQRAHCGWDADGLQVRSLGAGWLQRRPLDWSRSATRVQA
jgi:hypothetical protein